MFTITHNDTTTSARLGTLKTAHHTIETPFFMPIATKGTVKHITPQELKTLGTECLISNAFILYLQPGLQIIKKFRGIHNFMQWDRGIFTDSGGFQILSPKFLRTITDKGVAFNNPFTKKNEFFTPEKVMNIEITLGSDVAMALDHVPHHDQSYTAMTEAVRRTHLWAERCLNAHKNTKQLLFGITQGGIYPDLREKSAKFMSKLDFDGIALGGFCIGEDKTNMLTMVKHSLRAIDPERPHYLMGVGSPEDIIESIGYGIDIFDSRYPTQNARHGSLFTKKGPIDIAKKRYARLLGPIDTGCTCQACTTFSTAFIHHLFRTHEPMAERYATMHNIHFIHTLISNIKTAIREHRFERFKKEFLKEYKV